MQEEEAVIEEQEEVLEKTAEMYFTDLEDNRLNNLQPNQTVYLNVVSENIINEVISISFPNREVDFKYQGQILQDDRLPNYLIGQNHEKIELETVKEGISEQVTEIYFTDLDNNRLENTPENIKILLNIQSENRIGDIVSIEFPNPIIDFKYNGKVLENDTLSNYKIQSNHDTIELETLKQK